MRDALDGDGGGIIMGLVCGGLGLWWFWVVFLLFHGVTGALWREVNSRVATAPNTESRT